MWLRKILVHCYSTSDGQSLIPAWGRRYKHKIECVNNVNSSSEFVQTYLINFPKSKYRGAEARLVLWTERRIRNCSLNLLACSPLANSYRALTGHWLKLSRLTQRCPDRLFSFVLQDTGVSSVRDVFRPPATVKDLCCRGGGGAAKIWIM